MVAPRFFSWVECMRVAVYIDGFSFYYACFSGPTKATYRQWKWVDFELLSQRLFPFDEIAGVHYFTAIAPNPPDDPDQADRHANYLEALRAHSAVNVHVGRFVKSKREVELARPLAGVEQKQTAYVWQEKKSDVALASRLTMDAVQSVADVLVLITNDSDFVPAVQMVKKLTDAHVGIISPDLAVAKELAQVSDFSRRFDKGLLAVSQLPNPVITPTGRSIHKPHRWESEHS